MQKPFFSIVVVALNPGDRLEKTLNSIANQSFQDYEVILKDGGSTDGSLEKLQEKGYFNNKNYIKIKQKKDKSIYDGMNQAMSYVNGRYVQFLNCGDYFYSDTVLEEMAKFICDESEKQGLRDKHDVSVDGKDSKGNYNESVDGSDCCSEKNAVKKIFYGNQYNQLQDTIIYSAPQINDFTCYRNVPCHQVCFYDSRLFEKRAYELEYKVRADYEHFLYSIYEEGATGVFVPVIVVSYEGGGFSETKENRKRSAVEHKEITMKYLGRAKVFRYRMIMWLTLAPVRTRISENPALSGVYNGMKNSIYKILRK